MHKTGHPQIPVAASKLLNSMLCNNNNWLARNPPKGTRQHFFVPFDLQIP